MGKGRKALLSCLVLSAFAFSLPAAASASRATHGQMEQMETKAEMQTNGRTIDFTGRGNRHAEMLPAEQENLPTTESSVREAAQQRTRAFNDRGGNQSANAHANMTIPERVHQILTPADEQTTSTDNGLNAADVYTLATHSQGDAILGLPMATEEQCVKFLLSMNPNPHISTTPEKLVSYYYQEGTKEGIRPDVAFAQALKETGFFRYGGTVTPDQNNYCGLGTTSSQVKGAYFASPQLGVRAHIQHLLAYASTKRPSENVIDPRYDLVRASYGERTLGRWEDLNGRWAVPGNSYGESILSLFSSILAQ